MKQDVHDCSAPSDATWKTADAEEWSSGAQGYSMTSSEESLEVAKRIHVPLKAQSVFNHHPTIMGDIRNGRFKFLFEFAIKLSNLSRNSAQIFRGRFSFLSSASASFTAPDQDCGNWEPPSKTVWNCNLHDRFVQCGCCRIRSCPTIGCGNQRRAIILPVPRAGAV